MNILMKESFWLVNIVSLVYIDFNVTDLRDVFGSLLYCYMLVLMTTC
jgi:hypothetical protein